jgi:hypothetical protein
VDFGGQGGCFHEGTGSCAGLRAEAAPVNANHPVSKRVFYMDAQLGNLNGANEIYDRKGELWKVFMVGKSHPDSHLPINKGSGIGIDDAFSMVDVQSKHCTTGQFKGQVDPKLNRPPCSRCSTCAAATDPPVPACRASWRRVRRLAFFTRILTWRPIAMKTDMRIFGIFLVPHSPWASPSRPARPLAACRSAWSWPPSCSEHAGIPHAADPVGPAPAGCHPPPSR